jgi:hypothetical protein
MARSRTPRQVEALEEFYYHYPAQTFCANEKRSCQKRQWYAHSKPSRFRAERVDIAWANYSAGTRFADIPAAVEALGAIKKSAGM